MAAPRQNSNAQKWTEKKLLSYLSKIMKAAEKPQNLFLGRQLKRLKLYKDIWAYWKKKFANNETVMEEMSMIETMFESNLFTAAVRQEVPASVAIFALRNAHNWKDKEVAEVNNKENSLKLIHSHSKDTDKEKETDDKTRRA